MRRNCTHFKSYANTKQNDKYQSSSSDELCQKNETIKNGNTEKFYFKKEKFMFKSFLKTREKYAFHLKNKRK